MNAEEKPNIENHLEPAGSNEHTDYLVKADKNMDYKVEMAKQFIAARSNKTFGFPNVSFHILPYIIEVREKGMLTQLRIQNSTKVEMDELHKRINALFEKAQ